MAPYRTPNKGDNMYAGYRLNPLGSHSTDATISSATTITPETNADYVAIQAFTNAVRYTLDGTTPTASVGFRIAANDSDVVSVGPNTVIKVIEETASASVQWQSFQLLRDNDA